MDVITNVFKDLFDISSSSSFLRLKEFFSNIGNELRGAVEFLADLFNF